MVGTLDLSRYTLRFSDEFDNLSLNDGTTGSTGTWTPDGYWGQRTLPANAERQFYVDPAYKDLGLNPFSVGDGALTISAQPASNEVRPHIDNLDYTSGMITSEQSFSAQYGYFEMRAQLPEGQGLWPAFWLLTADGEWPPEYDVVEVLGHEPDRLYGTTHFRQGDGIERDHIDAAPFDSSDGFHTYGLEWNPDEVIWYYDGVEAGRAPNRVTDQPMYMIANLAVGGHWPGNPDGSTPFPAEMSIDYIRAYQLNPTRAAVGVPDDWTPVDPETAFTQVSGSDAPATWEYRSTMAVGQESVSLEGDWARYIEGNDGDNFIRGSDVSPYNELVGGRGNDTLEGRGGIDVFVVRNGDGNDTILDLSNTMGNTDKIRLDGFHFAHFNDLQPWLDQVGADVVLRLDEDQALLLRNTTIDALAPEQFVFTNMVAAPSGAPQVPARPAPASPNPILTPPVTPEPTPAEVSPQPEATPGPDPIVVAPIPAEPDATGSVPGVPSPAPVMPQPEATPVAVGPLPPGPIPDVSSMAPDVTGLIPGAPHALVKPQSDVTPVPTEMPPVPDAPAPVMPQVVPVVTGSGPEAPLPAPVVPPSAPPLAPMPEPAPINASPGSPSPGSCQHEHEPVGHGDLLTLLRDAGFDLTTVVTPGSSFAVGLGLGLGLGLTADGALNNVEVNWLRDIDGGLRNLLPQGVEQATAGFDAGNAPTADWISLAVNAQGAPVKDFAFDTPLPLADDFTDLSSMMHSHEYYAAH